MEITKQELKEFGLKCAKWDNFMINGEARENVINRLVKKTLSEHPTAKDTSEANLNIGCVTKRLFTFKEAQEMYFAGFLATFSDAELLEKDKDGNSIIFKKVVSRCYS